jgi:hypothetical protein
MNPIAQKLQSRLNEVKDLNKSPLKDGFLEIGPSKQFTSVTLDNFKKEGLVPRYFKKLEQNRFVILFDDSFITLEGRTKKIVDTLQKVNRGVESAKIAQYDESPFLEIVFNRPATTVKEDSDINTVADIPDNWAFVSDSAEVDDVKEKYSNVKKTIECDSFFVETGKGEYLNIYGMIGVVPDLNKLVYPIVINGVEYMSEAVVKKSFQESYMVEDSDFVKELNEESEEIVEEKPEENIEEAKTEWDSDYWMKVLIDEVGKEKAIEAINKRNASDEVKQKQLEKIKKLTEEVVSEAVLEKSKYDALVGIIKSLSKDEVESAMDIIGKHLATVTGVDGLKASGAFEKSFNDIRNALNNR